MAETDEIVRLKLQVIQLREFLQQAQTLMKQCNTDRSFYKTEHGKALTLLKELDKRVLGPTKSQRDRIATLVLHSTLGPPLL